MNLLLSCSLCGQPFHVAESTLGKHVKCPLCHRVVLAERPAVPLVAVAVAAPVASLPEPLPLDDEPLPPQTPLRSPWRRRLKIGGLVLTILLTAGIAWGMAHFGSGEFPPKAWREFSPPLGRCSVFITGTPKEETIPVDGFASQGGRKFIVKNWYQQVLLGIGWIDLDLVKLKKTTFDQVVLAERDRQIKRNNWKLIRESPVNFVSPGKKFVGQEFEFQSENGSVFERYYLEQNTAQPRLYFLLIAGKKLRPGHPTVERFFDSFRPLDE